MDSLIERMIRAVVVGSGWGGEKSAIWNGGIESLSKFASHSLEASIPAVICSIHGGKLGDRALSDSLMKILPEGGDLSAFNNHDLHLLPKRLTQTGEHSTFPVTSSLASSWTFGIHWTSA